MGYWSPSLAVLVLERFFNLERLGNQLESDLQTSLSFEFS